MNLPPQPNKEKNPYSFVDYNLNTSHPLIPSSQEYDYYKKYVSIHSEDRDILKFPSASKFEIEMPEDILNIITVRLSSWTFPANYSTFSLGNSNTFMTFKINNPYNPGEHNYSNELQEEIFKCLFLSKDEDYLIFIEEGFYNPDQMTIELTNKFNDAVNRRIKNYFVNNKQPDLLKEFLILGGYQNFIVVYNSVSQRIWFGNRSDGFVLTNETQILKNPQNNEYFCNVTKGKLPDYSNWGLPGNIGLDRCNTNSLNSITANQIINSESTSLDTVLAADVLSPRFFYGDVFPGDNGFWLLPDSIKPGCVVSWVECPYKINLMGPSCFYMEIDGLNNMNQTSPYNVSDFTLTTNKTNGRVNSAFAKIGIPTTPISQWFDRDAHPYKLFVPPAERLRKLNITLRYHNGQAVDFGTFDYSFTLEFLILIPQQLKKYRGFGIGSSSIFSS
jgi:hypothetical protein